MPIVINDDLRVSRMEELAPPIHVIHEFPRSAKAEATVKKALRAGHEIISGEDDRLIVLIGPCSIHDPKAALEYASRLEKMREELIGELEIIMRVYFEKPRTTVGWKGLINDPDLNGTFRINHGLRLARELILRINEMGLPVGVEYLDTVSPQYIADMVSWGAIGARTTESQVHRELASGLSCPIGFKNGTSGNPQVAVDAVGAAKNPHSFLGVTKVGISAIVHTSGNPDCHIILRGGRETNYDAKSIANACEMLAKAGHHPAVMVDASHSNSRKMFKNQLVVVRDLCEQLCAGSRSIMGVMIESNLIEGNQKLNSGKPLVYGQSVTDACIGWEDTETVLRELATAVRTRRAGSAA